MDEKQPRWRSYELYVPQSDILTEFHREGDCESWIGYAADFVKDFNIANLRWRYTGIGREQLGWPTEEQIDSNTSYPFRVGFSLRNVWYGAPKNTLLGPLNTWH